MIQSINGYPMDQELIESNRYSMGHQLDQWTKTRDNFKPEVVGGEVMTPEAVEFYINDIQSKYGVFMIQNSEVQLTPVKTEVEVQI